jgi:ParB family transcriptional regulator, chromosome partitioning protein
MEIRTIPLDRVQDAKRLRPVDADWVALLADRIAADGLLQPIAVRAEQADGTFPLIAGGHRVAAARLLGWQDIPAQVFDVSELQARLMEIEENLIRAELNALDRAVFLAEHKQVWEALHPATRHGGNRRNRPADQVGKNDDLKLERFTAAAREKFGLSESTVQRAVRMAGRLDPKVRDLIAGLPITRMHKELEALSVLDKLEQPMVARLLHDGQADTVMSALRRVRSLPLDLPQDKDEVAFQRHMASWRKLSAKNRKRVLAALAFEGVTLPTKPEGGAS